MHASRKYLALLTLAESSEIGRLTVLRAVVEAARNAQLDMDKSIGGGTSEELLELLSRPEEWPDDAAWMDAFEYRLAQIALPGLEFAICVN